MNQWVKCIPVIASNLTTCPLPTPLSVKTAHLAVSLALELRGSGATSKGHREQGSGLNQLNRLAVTTEPIRVTDGAGYDRFMGFWSRLAGQALLDWIAPNHGQRWLDVGCGNGAFTQLVAEQCEPLNVVGIDPSEEQLAMPGSNHCCGASSS